MDLLGLGKLAPIEMHRRQGKQSQHAIAVELHGVACRAHGLVEGCRVVRTRTVAVPKFVEIVVGEDGPGIGVTGVAAHGFLEACAGGRMFFSTLRAPVVEGAQDAVIGKQGLGAFAPKRIRRDLLDDAVGLRELARPGRPRAAPESRTRSRA